LVVFFYFPTVSNYTFSRFPKKRHEFLLGNS
jgi:hypothetical protein